MHIECVRHSRQQRGLSLVELIIAIVIISVSVVGVLSVMNVTVKSSADPMMRKQAIAMAEAIMEEVLSKDFADPPAGYTETVPATCANRMQYDDVGDYNCFDGTTDAKKIHGDSTLGATPITGLTDYRAKVVVTPVTVNGLGMNQIAVTVDGGGDSIQLFGYRANY